MILIAFGCMYTFFQTDKLESDFYDLGETEIKLSYAYGTSQNDKDMISSPRGTLTIKSFRGPRYTIKQNPFNKVEWEKLEVLLM